MDNVLGVLGLIVFLACVVALAAAVTWVVVRLTPERKADDSPPAV